MYILMGVYVYIRIYIYADGTLLTCSAADLGGVKPAALALY